MSLLDILFKEFTSENKIKDKKIKTKKKINKKTITAKDNIDKSKELEKLTDVLKHHIGDIDDYKFDDKKIKQNNIQKDLKQKGNLKKAFIYKEIFDKPISKR